MIPEGTSVKRGDVLAVLDSSDYEELASNSADAGERANADHVQSSLELEIAKLAVHEFEEGTLKGRSRTSRGRSCWLDRTFRVPTIGWPGRGPNDGQRLYTRGGDDCGRIQTRPDLALAFAAGNSVRAVQQVHGPQDFEGTERVGDGGCNDAQLPDSSTVHCGRLELLEKQVENCTIRAPYYGFVIYANNADRRVFIEPGMTVRQRQQLFFLPDLSQMEVVAMIHESIVDQVSPSMRCTFRLRG